MKRSVFPYLFAGILAALLVATAAFFATAQAWPLPSVEDTGPKAKDAQLGVTFTGDFVPANLVDAIVRQQSRQYLERVVAQMLPQVPPGMVVGVISGMSIQPVTSVYLSGWTTANATQVEIKVDGKSPSYFVPTTKTDPPIASTWTWTIPTVFHDGKQHLIYARAIRSTGTVIGPLDNAKSTARFPFLIGNAPVAPPPPPEPPPVPAFTDARVAYAAGVVTVEAKADFDKVELLIDSRDVAPWYQGLKTLVNGKAEFTLPPAAMDGAEHLLDVRLYKTNAPGVFRPDGYPIRAKLIAP